MIWKRGFNNIARKQRLKYRDPRDSWGGAFAQGFEDRVHLRNKFDRRADAPIDLGEPDFDPVKYREDYWNARHKEIGFTDDDASNRMIYRAGAVMGGPMAEYGLYAGLGAGGVMAYNALFGGGGDAAQNEIQQQMLAEQQMRAYFMQQQQRMLAEQQAQMYLAARM